MFIADKNSNLAKGSIWQGYLQPASAGRITTRHCNYRYMKSLNFKDLILSEDNNVIVINKPPFLASINERNSLDKNVLTLAKAYCQSAQVCHRLDKQTSGALIIATNPESYRHISMQFEHRKVKKIYHAIIEGNHKFEAKCVDQPINVSKKASVSINKTLSKPKPAQTVFNSLQCFNHYTLVECQPITGRMHQIRIHLATQKAAIAADTMYHGNPPFLSAIKKDYRGNKEVEQALIKRFALHAYEITFSPSEGMPPITVQAPYPKDFTTLLTQLNKFDSQRLSCF